ncbi:hypothetical protein BX285_6613 [Streptomyces sp. 1114.5]|uniref:DUF6939 family protein n=1 Tax=unclassified Streptomyces TaxID=2593676 RepID=UPI000BC5BB98|nr:MULTISPECIES: hypothetical protein [unclassified Streptomyces]RKT09518.1 hypothetical protein BX285_6613 [Streptomyces sp. 1114.5]SOB88476.1 hypothetical protein SAMN06272789_6759 [Streptomyces sp. 1331.2]
MSIRIASRRRSPASLTAAFPGAEIIDVTSKAPDPWVRLSPFYPHGGIPVPYSDGVSSESVEGIWQALKVFQDSDVDPAKLTVTTMVGLKRTVRRYGPVLGHRAGLHGDRLLPYETARRRIYLPAYRWILEHRVADLVELLRSKEDVVLLDYTTNGDVADPSSPLSHAALIQLHIEGRWPEEDGTAAADMADGQMP